MVETEIGQLRAENEYLKAKVIALEKQILQLETHQTLFDGARGESIVSRLVGGEITAYGKGHDIEISGKDGLRIEVKMASLNQPVKTSSTLRWVWGKILGEGGNKEYDWLILIGKKDDRYMDEYPDSDSPYIFFAIPKHEVQPLLSTQGRFKAIYLTTNPYTARSKTSILYSQYMVTTDQLSKQFGL